MSIAAGDSSTSNKVSAFEWAIMLAISGLLIGLSWFKILPLELPEVLGAATGGICSWLIVRGDVLNWPVGMANFLFYAYLLFKDRIYADAGVQVIFLIISVFGWWEWRRGSGGKPLPIVRTSRKEWIGLSIVAPLAFGILASILLYLHDASPFLDAVTSILSLSAQFLLSRKRLEHWYLWICAHSIYIPLYISRGLELTAALYVLYLVMCIIGLIKWKKEWREAQAAA